VGKGEKMREAKVVAPRANVFRPPRQRPTEVKSVQHLIDSQRREIEALMRQQERMMMSQAEGQTSAAVNEKGNDNKLEPKDENPLVVSQSENSEVEKSLIGDKLETSGSFDEQIEKEDSEAVESREKKNEDQFEAAEESCESPLQMTPENEEPSCSKNILEEEKARAGKEPLYPLPVTSSSNEQQEKSESDEEKETGSSSDSDYLDDVGDLVVIDEVEADDDDCLPAVEAPASSVNTDGDLRNFLERKKMKKSVVEPEKSKIASAKVDGCICCSAFGHTLKNCQDFISMNPLERTRLLKKFFPTCFNCLEFGHSNESCPLPQQCLVSGCNIKHHTFLHKAIAPEREEVQRPSDQELQIQEMLTKLRNEDNNWQDFPSKQKTRGDFVKSGNKICCTVCGDNHNVMRCPKNPCDRCHETDHVSADCKDFNIFSFCKICKYSHRATECSQKPCKMCQRVGHYARICPNKSNKVYTCNLCQGPHHMWFCPDSPCMHCHDNSHLTAECTYGPAGKLKCRYCNGPHHIRVCPKRPDGGSKKSEHLCTRCGSKDHVFKVCPELKCEVCSGFGHLRKNCPLAEKFEICPDCEGKHKVLECSLKPCRLCQAKGHTAIACPTINMHTICDQCGGNHHVHFCPMVKCKKCKTLAHTTGGCPFGDKPEVCSGCGAPHHIRYCPKQPCCKCKANDHVTAECATIVKCRRCHEIGHSIDNCHNTDKGIRCLKCHIFGHHITNCPFVECKNCGASGHWVKDCTNKKNEFRKKQAAEEKKIISIDYNHLRNVSGSHNYPEKQPTTTTISSKPLMIHFYEKLIARGRNPELANQMMLYWRLAEHNEESLRTLFFRHSPCTRDTLRLILVSELANAPSMCRPMDVSASDLLDATIDYFMPTATDNEDNIVASTPLTASSMPLKFWQSNKGPENVADDGFEGRLKSLRPLQEFIANKMRSLSGIVQVQESYITELSTSIATLLAQVGLCLFTLRRDFTTFGKESLSATIEQKMSTSTVKLPERVSSAYIVAVVADFLTDYCK
jgi:hypothetical protein